MKDGIYIETFAVKDGTRYNLKTISCEDVSKILVDSLMDGIQNLVLGKEDERVV